MAFNKLTTVSITGGKRRKEGIYHHDIWALHILIWLPVCSTSTLKQEGYFVINKLKTAHQIWPKCALWLVNKFRVKTHKYTFSFHFWCYSVSNNHWANHQNYCIKKIAYTNYYTFMMESNAHSHIALFLWSLNSTCTCTRFKSLGWHFQATCVKCTSRRIIFCLVKKLLRETSRSINRLLFSSKFTFYQ